MSQVATVSYTRTTEPGALEAVLTIAFAMGVPLLISDVPAVGAMEIGAWLDGRHPDMTARLIDCDRLLIEPAAMA